MKEIQHHITLIVILLSMIACQNKKESQPFNLHWEQAGQLPEGENGDRHPGLAGAISGMVQNRLIIAGGANFPGALPWQGGTKTYYKDIFTWIIDSNSKLGFQNIPGELPYKVAYAAVATTTHGIVFAGGENETGLLANVSLLTIDTTTNEWVINALKPLSVPTTHAAATCLNNDVFIAGGETGKGATSAVWKMNLEDTSKGWQALPELPNPVSDGVLAAVALPSGKTNLYFAGGRCKQPNGISLHYQTVFKLSTGNKKWEPCASLPFGLSAASGAISPGEKWLIFSGDQGETFEKVEKLLVKISLTADSIEKENLLNEKAAIQSAHPGFSKQVLVYDFNLDKWTTSDSIPFEAPVTTNAFFYHNKAYLCSGEVRAGVRTPFILSATIIHEK